MKKIICIFIALSLIFCVPAVGCAYSDTGRHWASEEIDKWSDKGIIKGDGNLFYPDDDITRGDFAVIVDRIMTYQTPGENTFTDLNEDYYTLPLLRLSKQEIILGYENKIRPLDSISRQEAAVMLCRALLISPEEDFIYDFDDTDDIAPWAKGYMAAMTNKGFIGGSDGKLRPKSSISRAETVKLLDNMIDTLIDLPQTYSELSVGGLCIVNSRDAVIENSVFDGDVIVTSGAKAVFKNTEIKGSLIAQSPEKGSVRLENSSFGSLNAKNEYTVEIIDTQPEQETKPESSVQENENTDNEEQIQTEVSQDSSMPTVYASVLQDGMVQKNSMLNFDVFAYDTGGGKIPAIVTFNGDTIQPTWEDSEKASYTLVFTNPGENTVVITATDSGGAAAEISYTITYEPAQYGEKIGEAVFCIEAFTVGGGYIIPPVTVDVYEGVNAAYLLQNQLAEYGMECNYTGSPDGGFYLFEISNIPDFSPCIPDVMRDMLTAYGSDITETPQKENALAEFDFTSGAGWMYCINNSFPNVSISDYYPQDNDVIRIIFTTAYGSDIGGNNYADYDPSNDFFERTDRDALTRAIAQQGIESFADSIDIITKPDITQSEIDSLLNR